MLNNKKIIVSDYDGTFHVNEIDIVNNVKMVSEFRKEGNVFIIATGNNLETFKKVVQKYKIPYDYLILDQGSCIVDKEGNIIKTNYIDEKTKKIIYERITSKTDNIKICSPFSEKAASAIRVNSKIASPTKTKSVLIISC